MQREIRTAPEKAHYLSQFMTELPVNCLFDKGRTGCGGTTIAIENELDTIIAMPYVNLIKNKEAQHENLLGIYQGVTEEDILDYFNTHQIYKIAVTYDRLEYLIELLQTYGYRPYNDFYLLVDEWHILFNSYAFRNEAIKKVLFHSRQFAAVTYMTATPIEEEFILEELKDLPIVEMQWKNTVSVNIKPIITARPINKVCDLIGNAINGKAFENLHFFVNSVEFIAEAIKKSGIQPEQVRVICSSNNNSGKGKKSNQSKLGEAFKIESTTDAVKRINFYTSTCFEGCDINDVNGRTYIVSDSNKSHTLLDISTLIIQICGRIRDSKYKTEICHIFSETRYSQDVTYNEFKEQSEKQIQETKDWINDVNNMETKNRNTTIRLIEKGNKAGLNEMYIQKVDDKLYLDENLVKLDIVNFKITHHLYSTRVTISEEYQKYGFNVMDAERIIYTDTLLAKPNARISFEKLFTEYAQLKNDAPLFSIGNIDERIRLIEQEKPMVKEAYEILGEGKVRELKYNSTNLKRAILKQSTDKSIDSKIVKCLTDMGARTGSTRPTKEWKMILQQLYEDLGIYDGYNKIKRAKATDLMEWFEVKKVTRRINNKSTDVIVIIKERFIYI